MRSKLHGDILIILFCGKVTGIENYKCGALQLCLLYLDETTGASAEVWIEFNGRLASCRMPQARVLPH